MILVVYRGHGIFYPVYGSFFFLSMSFREISSRSETAEPQKKQQWLVHLYRNTRLWLMMLFVLLVGSDVNEGVGSGMAKVRAQLTMVLVQC